MIKIAHFHYNSAKNVNIGDEAHVLAIQDTLQNQLDNAEITNFPISFLCHYQIPPFIPMSHRLPLSIQNAARFLRGTSYSQLLKEINESDLVVIGGGGVYMDHLLPFNMPLLNQITTPIVVFGAGYNRNFGSAHFNDHQTKSIQELGNRAKLQSVRDVNTQTFLQELGVDSKLVGDPAMFLQKASGGSVKDEGLNIAINIAAHGWKSQAQFEATLLDAYTAMIKDIEKRHDAMFHYFVHHPNEQSVIERLKERGVRFASIVNSDARTTKTKYASVDLTVSMMLHSTILAFGEGKPSVCVGYDDKNKSFMDLTGQSERYVRVDELTADILTQKVTDLVVDLAKNTMLAQSTYLDLKATYDDFSQRVTKIVL